MRPLSCLEQSERRFVLTNLLDFSEDTGRIGAAPRR